MDHSINPEFSPKDKKKYSVDELFAAIREGNKSALSEGITWIESNDQDKIKMGQQLVKLCYPFSGKSRRIGVTGLPGAGKSTFIESIGNLLIDNGKKLAVLAIDPSSSLNKGSILGDKTRMQELSVQPNAFIRPTAAGNQLGGVARNTFESIILCESAGYEYIIIETVGVGQSETEVKELTDLFILLLIAGAGDELQGIKRGIMEMADIILINKADGLNTENARKAAREIKNAMGILNGNNPELNPLILLHSFEQKGLTKDVLSNVNQLFESLELNNKIGELRTSQQLHYFNKSLKINILNKIISTYNLNNIIQNKEKQIIKNKLSAFDAVDQILSEIKWK